MTRYPAVFSSMHPHKYPHNFLSLHISRFLYSTNSADSTPQRGGGAREPSASPSSSSPNPSPPGVSSSSSSSSTNHGTEGHLQEVNRDNNSTISTSVHSSNNRDVSSTMIGRSSHEDSERGRDELNYEEGEHGVVEGEGCLASLVEEAECLQIDGRGGGKEGGGSGGRSGGGGGGGGGGEGEGQRREGEREEESGKDYLEGEDDGDRETRRGIKGGRSGEQLQQPAHSGNGNLSPFPVSASSTSSSTSQSLVAPPPDCSTVPAFPLLAKTSSEPRPPAHRSTRGSIPASSEVNPLSPLPSRPPSLPAFLSPHFIML